MSTGLYIAPCRWIYPHEMTDKKVVTLVFSETLAHRMADTGYDNQFKILTGLYQRIDHLHRRRRVDIVVEFSDQQHQGASQQMGVLDIGAGPVRLINRVTHPLLVPPDFIHTVVVASAGRIGRLVKIGIEQQCRQASCPPAEQPKMPTRLVSILGYFLAAALIQAMWSGRPASFQVLIAHLLKTFGTERGGHAIDLHDYKTQLGQ